MEKQRALGRICDLPAQQNTTRQILPDEAQGNADARYVRPDENLCGGRCAGNGKAESRASDPSRIHGCGSLAKQRRRLDATRCKLLINRLMPDVADLAGRLRRAVVVVPNRRRESGRQQKDDSERHKQD